MMRFDVIYLCLIFSLYHTHIHTHTQTLISKRCECKHRHARALSIKNISLPGTSHFSFYQTKHNFIFHDFRAYLWMQICSIRHKCFRYLQRNLPCFASRFRVFFNLTPNMSDEPQNYPLQRCALCEKNIPTNFRPITGRFYEINFAFSFPLSNNWRKSVHTCQNEIILHSPIQEVLCTQIEAGRKMTDDLLAL